MGLEQRDGRLSPAYEHGAEDGDSAGAAHLNGFEDGGARIHSAWRTWRVPTAPAACVSWAASGAYPAAAPVRFTVCDASWDATA